MSLNIVKDYLKCSDEVLQNIITSMAVPIPNKRSWSDTEITDVIEMVMQAPVNSGDVMVGADPEFTVMRGTHPVNASHYFKGTQLGHDAHSRTAELRPPPGRPEAVSATIGELLQNAIEIAPGGVEFRAGGFVGRQTLGGHIHFSGCKRSAWFDEALSHFIGFPLATKSAPERIRASTYGAFGAYRTQVHGWEWREAPSWLAHPDLTRGSLTMAWKLGQLDDETRASLVKSSSGREELAVLCGLRGHYVNAFYQALANIQSLESINMVESWGLVRPAGKNNTGYPDSFVHPLRFDDHPFLTDDFKASLADIRTPNETRVSIVEDSDYPKQPGWTRDYGMTTDFYGALVWGRNNAYQFSIHAGYLREARSQKFNADVLAALSGNTSASVAEQASELSSMTRYESLANDIRSIVMAASDYENQRLASVARREQLRNV